jgi:hypothetical protein
MARERLYRNNAERQAAYRARHTQWQPAPQRLLASLGEELHGRLRQAVAAGTSRVPAPVLGRRADETLINLIRYLTRGLLPGEAEPPVAAAPSGPGLDLPSREEGPAEQGPGGRGDASPTRAPAGDGRAPPL